MPISVNTRLMTSVSPGSPNSPYANMTATAPVAKASGTPASENDDEYDDEQDAQQFDAHACISAAGTTPRSRSRLTMPCRSNSSPAIGIAIFTGQIGGFQGVPVPSDCRKEPHAI